MRLSPLYLSPILLLVMSTARTVPAQPILLDVTTTLGNDSLIVGEPGAIIFSMDARSHDVQAVGYPLQLTFTGGNWIGAMSDPGDGNPLDNVFPSARAESVFSSIAWNTNFGQGTDPDTMLYGFTSFGGPWIGSGEVFRIEVNPTGPGTVRFDTALIPPASGMYVIDPSGVSLPFIWEGDDKVITAYERSVILKVRTSTGHDTLYVDQPGSIRFILDANGYDVSGVTLPFELVYGGGNWIGPLSDAHDADPLNNVFPSASAQAVFAAISWSQVYGNGSDPDTMLYGFVSFGGPWSIFGELFRIDVTPMDTGTVRFDSIMLPPSNRLKVTDPGSMELPVQWAGDGMKITSAVAMVQLYATTSSGSDTIYPGSASRIYFHLDARGYEIGATTFPLQWTFSSSNFVGPLSPDSGNVLLAPAAAPFESVAWNENFGQGTNPDTTLYGFIDFGGGAYTADAVLWSVEFTPTDTGMLSIDTVALPPVSGPAVLDTNAQLLPFAWTAPTFVVAPCPVALMGDVNLDGLINSSDIIYFVNFVFKSGPDPQPERAVGDVNCSGGLNASDIIYLVNYVFKGGSAPCACFVRRL